MAKLLLLDDDAATLAWMGPALELKGHEVRAFTRAIDALEALEEWTPDLIVADIVMTEMDGLEFARLTRRLHGVPLMFVSVASLRAEAVIAGAAGYVQKPATAAEVRAEVERVLGNGKERGTILVVDDDAAARWLFRSFLGTHFDVLEAEHGERALEILSSHRVDLAIVDVHMPVMGGAELIRRMRSIPSLERLPVIVQTGDRSALGAPVWRDLHVAHVIEKDDFVEWIANRIDAHLEERRPPAAERREPPREHDPGTDASAGTDAPKGWSAFARLSRPLTDELPPEQRIEELVRVSSEVTGATRAVLALDEDGLFLRATADASSTVTLAKRPLFWSDDVPVSLITKVFESGEPVLLGEPTGGGRHGVDANERSVLAVPIARGNRTLGVLYLERDGAANAFSHELLETFRRLSPFIAMALDDLRLQRDLAEAAEQRETIRSLVTEREEGQRCAAFLADATRLLFSLDFEQALDGVAHLAVPILADGCAIDVFDGEPRRFVAVSPRSTSALSLEIHPTVLRGHSLVYELGSVSHLGVPVRMKGHLTGAITLSASYDRTYTRGHLELVEELARRTALSIDNARLYRRTQEAVRERDDFLSIAAHEIRGPINSIHLAVQSIRQAKVPADALPRLFELVERQDRRLSQFVDELLDLGRIRAGALQLETQRVDLGEVVAEVAVRLGAELTLSGSPLTVTAHRRVVGQWDKSRLDQVVHNLLSNAIKFGLGKPIEISLESKGRTAILSIRDHGVGIDREALQRIFRPFERGVSTRQYGGLGLGLHIVKTIVDAFHGAVTVQSEPGKGTTFRVELPLPRIGDERHAHSDGR